MSPSHFESLELAATDVLDILRSIPQFSEARIAIIGGFALWKYYPGYRTTEDIDFVITAEGAPSSVKQKFLQLENSPFEQRAQIFLYNAPTGVKVQIDILPDWQTPYLPPSAQKLSSIEPGSPPPYISPIDLVVFKIGSCGLRAEMAKKIRDADDAKFVLTALTSQLPLTLNAVQKTAVLDGLEAVVALTGDDAWWRSKLGI